MYANDAYIYDRRKTIGMNGMRFEEMERNKNELNRKKIIWFIISLGRTSSSFITVPNGVRFINIRESKKKEKEKEGERDEGKKGFSTNIHLYLVKFSSFFCFFFSSELQFHAYHYRHCVQLTLTKSF